MKTFKLSAREFQTEKPTKSLKLKYDGLPPASNSGIHAVTSLYLINNIQNHIVMRKQGVLTAGYHTLFSTDKKFVNNRYYRSINYPEICAYITKVGALDKIVWVHNSRGTGSLIVSPTHKAISFLPDEGPRTIVSLPWPQDDDDEADVEDEDVDDNVDDDEN